MGLIGALIGGFIFAIAGANPTQLLLSMLAGWIIWDIYIWRKK